MIYADNASTAKMPKAVLESILPYLTDEYGNPSSSHSMGISASNAVKTARSFIASSINANENEIVFTSGGSESNIQAILTASETGKSNGRNKIIISAFEHDSVYITAKSLEKSGFEVITLSVDKNGFVSVSELERLIDEKTCLVSVMTANNEIGTIQPISEIGRICRQRGVLFHTDAVQAVGHINIDVKSLNVDMLSLSAHKFGGMKGVGALYIRNGIQAYSLITGGPQERSRRAGTENVAGIVSMAKALEISLDNLSEKQKNLSAKRDRLAEKLLKIPNSVINGNTKKRLAGNLNISFKDINSESLLMILDDAEICASGGSACHTGDPEPSRTLKAIGLTDDYALGTVRFSLSDDITDCEIDYIAETVEKAVETLR